MLDAIERAAIGRGHQVTVLTVRPPQGQIPKDVEGVRVRRASVLRDASGYVRGYLPYLSFDLKVAFRMLFTPRGDVYVVEPPPTTGAVVRVACALLRRPYVYDVADLWSDAAALATSSRLVLKLLRAVELFALRGADHAIAVSTGVADRMRELDVRTPTTVVRFGADTSVFHYLDAPSSETSPYFVYPGTYSEWHGADILVDAFAAFARHHPEYRLTFVGNGSERALLEKKVAEYGLTTVDFRAPIDAASLNRLLAGATASLATLKPGQGYDYAFTTKVLTSIAAGCPVVFAGVGPTAEFIHRDGPRYAIGVATDYEADAITNALFSAAAEPASRARRRELATWAAANYSIAASAETVVSITESVVAGRSGVHL